MITKYFKKAEEKLEEYDHIIEDYILDKQKYTQEKGMLVGEIFFNDSSELDFTEAVNTNKKEKQKYSYHYMDKEKEVIFRYDNVPHHRAIKTFPHHKHTPEGVLESEEPTLGQILDEIEQNIIDK